MTRTADKLISEIRQDISFGILKPGDQLKEVTLAQRFGVSRTPIREAIRAMVDCGLLEKKSRKGVIVRVLGAKELLDLFEVAAELEGMACRLAAASLTEEGVKDLLSSLGHCRETAEANDSLEYAKANLEFHKAIHDMAGNLTLVNQLQQIQVHINSYRSMPYKIIGRLQESTQEHADICELILSGEGSKACDMMRDHMMVQGRRLPSVIARVEQQNNP
jgi:DNA-binding GntR family transcriptional regulator